MRSSVKLVKNNFLNHYFGKFSRNRAKRQMIRRISNEYLMYKYVIQPRNKILLTLSMKMAILIFAIRIQRKRWSGNRKVYTI
jgi:hypothetical protein